MKTIDLQEFQECVGDLIDRVQEGEVATITKRGQPVARLIPAGSLTRSEATVRPGDGSRYLPSPIKLRGNGPSALSYVRGTEDDRGF